MVDIFLFFLGLCLGSFVNALVWRLRELELVDEGKGDKRLVKKLFKANSRSMCPECHHTLQPLDLVPVFSWLFLQGKCRYCKKPISIQYPAVELATAGLFACMYAFWPQPLTGAEPIVFGLWLIAAVILVAMSVYDFRWMLLPDKLMVPLFVIASAIAAFNISTSDNLFHAALNTFLAVMIGGTIFYLIFQLSGGKMIGGGDVKLGWALGLMLGTAVNAMLMLFLAGLGGSFVALILLITGKLKRNALIPFGPFLIFGALVVLLFGASITDWYQSTFLLVG